MNDIKLCSKIFSQSSSIPIPFNSPPHFHLSPSPSPSPSDLGYFFACFHVHHHMSQALSQSVLPCFSSFSTSISTTSLHIFIDLHPHQTPLSFYLSPFLSALTHPLHQSPSTFPKELHNFASIAISIPINLPPPSHRSPYDHCEMITQRTITLIIWSVSRGNMLIRLEFDPYPLNPGRRFSCP